MVYDVVIVGARCAGSSLAIPLAREGRKVLLVDAAPPNADQPLSTHLLSGYGMGLLDELGLGERVRAIAPPLSTFLLGAEEHIACITYPAEGRPSCARRSDLDAILLEGAREAGAEIRMRTRLVDVLREGDRVIGVVVEHEGQREEIRAGLVVGADGQHSTVAARVAAQEYKVVEGGRACFFGYFRRPDWFGDAPEFRGGVTILHVGDVMFNVFPVNTDQLLINVCVPLAQADEWTGDKRALHAERLRRVPRLARLADCEPVGKIVAFLKPRYFFRQAAGSGWALVGDSGLFLDPTTGLGISDALRDSASLANAILEGSESALTRYWRERDAQSLELFAWSSDQGRADYNSVLSRAVLAELAAKSEYRQRLNDVLLRTLPPFALLPLSAVLGIVAREVSRGRFSAVGEFLAIGKRNSAVMKELKEWRARVPPLPSATPSSRWKRPTVSAAATS